MPQLDRSWGVADIADFEFLLRSERNAERAAVARDRQIYRELLEETPEVVRVQRDLLRSWLEARRYLEPERYFGGADLVNGWKLLVTGAVLTSIVLGVGHAAGVLLLLDQNGHVSATKAALATVGVQLLVTTVALALWTVRAVLHRQLGAFMSLRVSILRAVLPRVVGRGRRRKFVDFLEQIGSLEQSYRRLLGSHLVMAAQFCVIGMSLGLLGSLEFYHFLSEDIRFGWSVTRDVRPETVHSIVSFVAAPWSNLIGGGLPSLDQVLESRLSREVAVEWCRRKHLGHGPHSSPWPSLHTGCCFGLESCWWQEKRAADLAESPVLCGPQVDELIRRMTSDPEPEQEDCHRPIEAPAPKEARPWWQRVCRSS